MPKFNTEAWRPVDIEHCPECRQAVQEEAGSGTIYEIIAGGPIVGTVEEVIARVYSPHNMALFMHARELYDLVKRVKDSSMPVFDGSQAIQVNPDWLEKVEKVFKQIEEI